jgi:potassium uptake TrkH family protein
LDAGEYHRLPRWYSRLLGLGTLVLVVYEIGFVGRVDPLAHWLTVLLVALFAWEQAVGWMRNHRRPGYAARWALHIGIAAVTALAMIGFICLEWMQAVGVKLSILLHGMVQGAMLASLCLRALRYQAQITGLSLRPGWIFMGSFAFAILAGMLLLKLPRSVVDGAQLSWLDALFTSTSAVCVTGLAVVNTAEHFSATGQVIVLSLIQIGGLGIMTITFYLGNLLFRGMSLHDRKVLGEMISERHLAEVAGSTRFIVAFTFIAEALGALWIYFAMPEDRGVGERAFQAVFHSVSSFCNAGFSTIPGGLADPWLLGNWSLQLAVAALVIMGGLGAMVVRDILRWARCGIRRVSDPHQPRRRLRVHTRLVVLVTGVLLLGGAATIYTSEFLLHEGNENGGRALTAFFHSFTARTAGFNTVDMGAIGPVTVHILVLLMFVGGAPGGTAGGLRVTVFSVAVLHVWNSLRVVPDIVMFRRKLPEGVGVRALAIVVLTVGWIFVNFTLLRQLQPDVTDTRLVFELVSAFSTVGLSMNLTTDLTVAAKSLIIVNMFVGRIGLITVASTLIPASPRRQLQHPPEDIILV